MNVPKLVLVTALATVALVGALARPVTAAAATPCWKTLLTDWYDGRIDNVYPLHCYTDALKHLPADVQTYSSAHDDIVRALDNARARLRKAGQKVTPNTPVPPSSNGGSGPTSSGGNTSKTKTGKTSKPTTVPATSTPEPGKQQGKGLTKIADKLNPSSPSSLPLPLLVLGGLAILLVAAGAAGLLAKRWQGRKPAP